MGEIPVSLLLSGDFLFLGICTSVKIAVALYPNGRYNFIIGLIFVFAP